MSSNKKEIRSDIIGKNTLNIIIRSIQKLYISYLLFGSGLPVGVYETFIAFIDQNARPDKQTVNIQLLNIMSKEKLSNFIKNGDLYYKLLSVLEFKDPQMRQVIQSVISLPSRFISEPALSDFTKNTEKVTTYPEDFRNLIIGNTKYFGNDDLFFFIYIMLKLLTNSNFNNKKEYLSAAMDLADSEIKEFASTNLIMKKNKLKQLSTGNLDGAISKNTSRAQMLRYNKGFTIANKKLRNRLKNFTIFCLNLKIVQYPYYINPKTLELYLCKAVKPKFTFKRQTFQNIDEDDSLTESQLNEKQIDLYNYKKLLSNKLLSLNKYKDKKKRESDSIDEQLQKLKLESTRIQQNKKTIAKKRKELEDLSIPSPGTTSLDNRYSHHGLNINSPSSTTSSPNISLPVIQTPNQRNKDKNNKIKRTRSQARDNNISKKKQNQKKENEKNINSTEPPPSNGILTKIFSYILPKTTK
jgi:hypothetical protein